MPPITDKEQSLLRSIAEGDRQAFEAVFDTYYQGLCYFAQSITGGKEDAEDIVQDAFYKLWQKRETLAATQHLKSFLFVVIRNACFDFIKQQQRQRRREQNFSIGPDTDEQKAFEPLLSETEIIMELHQEIQMLPDQCRRIFKMSYFDGKKNEEIARALDISYNTVRTQKLRALKLIRAALLKKGLLPAILLYMDLLIMYSENPHA